MLLLGILNLVGFVILAIVVNELYQKKTYTIKVLRNGAKLPYKAHEQDACFDVYAESRTLLDDGTIRYGTGLFVELPEDTYLDFRPRSSIYKTTMILSNSCGTIDQPYRGEIMANFYQLDEDAPMYKIGDRIGQVKLEKVLPTKWEYVDQLTTTKRGAGGFGSTGK